MPIEELNPNGFLTDDLKDLITDAIADLLEKMPYVAPSDLVDYVAGIEKLIDLLGRPQAKGITLELSSADKDPAGLMWDCVGHFKEEETEQND